MDYLPLLSGEDEIFGQRIANDGTLVGSAIQISFAGIDGDGEETGSFFDIGYNTAQNQILATFQSEEPGSNSYDIFATTLDAANYAVLESQSRVSDMGDVTGDNDYTANKPKQAFNRTTNNFLIVWEGDDNIPGNNEDEIFGQLWRSPPIAEIDIRGNTVTIQDGDITPDSADFTDFGSGPLLSPIVKEFTIHNTNTEQLVLNGIPVIVVSGVDASEFAITKQPNITIEAGNSTAFEITFTPTTVGIKTASISIDNNDAGENPYDFSIQGEGDGTLGVKEVEMNNGLNFYPNPSSDYINLNGLKNSCEYSIFNILGSEVGSGIAIPLEKIDIRNIKGGIYLLKIKGYPTIKFIKN